MRLTISRDVGGLPSMKTRWLLKLEHLLLFFGLLMLGIYFGARVDGHLHSRKSLANFRSEQLRLADESKRVDFRMSKPDFSLWSPKRVKAYENSLLTNTTPAIGVLRIPKIHLEVPVLQGTDDLSLNRGVGWIGGTARPGTDGNVGLAGHRDGFFRSLKDVTEGDAIELVTVDEARTYVIDGLVIVTPDDTSILASRAHPSLTLVTCYPFYFLGSAPERYIVQASMTESDSIQHAGIETANARTKELEEQKRAP